MFFLSFQLNEKLRIPRVSLVNNSLWNSDKTNIAKKTLTSAAVASPNAKDFKSFMNNLDNAANVGRHVNCIFFFFVNVNYLVYFFWF